MFWYDAEARLWTWRCRMWEEICCCCVVYFENCQGNSWCWWSFVRTVEDMNTHGTFEEMQDADKCWIYCDCVSLSFAIVVERHLLSISREWCWSATSWNHDVFVSATLWNIMYSLLDECEKYLHDFLLCLCFWSYEVEVTDSFTIASMICYSRLSDLLLYRCVNYKCASHIREESLSSLTIFSRNTPHDSLNLVRSWQGWQCESKLTHIVNNERQNQLYWREDVKFDDVPLWHSFVRISNVRM